MKSIGLGHRSLSMIVACVFFLFAVEAFGSLFSYDWDDRTLQDWSKQEPFGGQLKVNPGFGNPGGSMFAIDTAGGGVLWARAPDELSGNLSAYTGIYWDEYIQPQRFVRQATFIILEGEDGTRYQSEKPTDSEVVIGTWNSRFETFDMGDQSFSWVPVAGTASFDQVISNLETLFISMDTTELTGGVESWVDNFTAVPILGAVWLLGSCLAGLLAFKRKFGKKS